MRRVLALVVAGASGGTGASKNHRPARSALVSHKAHVEHMLRAEGSSFAPGSGLASGTLRQTVRRGGAAPAGSRGKCDENSPRLHKVSQTRKTHRTEENFHGDALESGSRLSGGDVRRCVGAFHRGERAMSVARQATTSAKACDEFRPVPSDESRQCQAIPRRFQMPATRRAGITASPCASGEFHRWWKRQGSAPGGPYR
jgi:hypothetical protein